MTNLLKKLEELTKIPKESFVDLLEKILNIAKQTKMLEVKQIAALLAGKGYAALLIILSLPFCFPIQIPGFSTPFGLLLAFLGLRIAFGKKLWWPKWLLEKNIASSTVQTLCVKTIKIFKAIQKILHPRLVFVARNPLLHLIHGVLIFILSLLLALPLPIPMTNMLAATPIFCIGLGLLEDDGVVILIGYFLAFVCFGVFTTLFLFGKEILLALS